MAKNYVNKEAMNINGGPMEAALKTYVADKNPQNMAAFIQALTSSRFLVPVEFPKKLDEEVVEKLKSGQKVTLQELPKMLPILLKNAQEEHFAPVYTSKEQLPKDHNYVAIMPVLMVDVIRISQVKDYKVKGILVNPNTDNLILSHKMIELLDRVIKGEEIPKVMEEAGFGTVQKQKISMTIEQFHGFARRNVEVGLIPKMAFDNKAKFIESLDSHGAKMLVELYKGMYKANVAFPYTEADFDIMALEIREDLTIVSLGFPSKNIVPGACTSGYLVWNPEKDEMQYFAVEKGKEQEPSRLIKVLSEGKIQILGEAPASGSEMYSIIELLDKA